MVRSEGMYKASLSDEQPQGTSGGPLLADESLQALYPGRMVIQARTPIQIFAAGVAEGLVDFESNLVHGFEAVGCESGHGDEHTLLAFPGQLDHRFLGVRLEPR